MRALMLWAVDENNVNPGLLGFGVVALLGLATWFLIKSMTRHLRKVDLPQDEGPEDPPRSSRDDTSGGD